MILETRQREGRPRAIFSLSFCDTDICVLQGMAFPAGPLAREQFMGQVVANLRIPTLIPAPTQTRRVRVIWSRRKGTKNRVFTPESLEALRELLGSFHNLEVIMAMGVGVGVGRNNNCQCLREGFSGKKINTMRCSRTHKDFRRDRRLESSQRRLVCSQRCHPFYVSTTPSAFVL